MKQHRTFGYSAAALALVLGLSACSDMETAMRNQPAQAPLAETAAAQTAAAIRPTFRVVDVRVSVPRELRVSEANRYYPAGDIVWREDPIGDRHAQVQKIVEDGLEMGASRLKGDVPVIVYVEVTRFHALTEKARYTIGGVHAIQFSMVLLDPKSGKPITKPKHVKADFDALGGEAAVRAEAKGITQKVRITHHLAKVLQESLSDPGGYRVQGTGFVGAVNQI